MEKNLLCLCQVAALDDTKVAFLGVLKPGRSNIVRITTWGVHDGGQPVISTAAAVACLSDGEWNVVGGGIGTVKGLVAASKGARRDGTARVAVYADQIHILRTRPVLSNGAHVVSNIVRRPPHLDLVVARHGCCHEFPSVDKLSCRARVSANRQIVIHLVSETQPDLYSLASELLQNGSDLRCRGRREITQRQGWHHGWLKHSTGAYNVAHDCRQLGSIVAAGGDLRVPAVSADLGTQGTVQLGHGVLRGLTGLSITGKCAKGNIVDIDAVGREPIRWTQERQQRMGESQVNQQLIYRLKNACSVLEEIRVPSYLFSTRRDSHRRGRPKMVRKKSISF